MLVGLPMFQDETFYVVPFGLLGLQTYATACSSYLGFRCYEPQRHWKINYGGGVILNFDRVAVGVRATGESIAGIAGFNF